MNEVEKRAFAGIAFARRLRRLAHFYGWHYTIRWFIYQDMFGVRTPTPHSAAIFQSMVASKFNSVLSRLGVTMQEAADAMSGLGKTMHDHPMAFMRLPRPKAKG